MKHFLAYVFLFIFSFQVLPVKELGKLLFKGQMTEEIHSMCSDGDGGEGKVKKNSEPFKLHTEYALSVEQASYIEASVTTAIHLSELLPVNFVPDILTPPPNC